MTKDNRRTEYLIRDKHEFQEQVFNRLAFGKEFIERKITTKEESKKCWSEFIKWDLYNLEMLRQAFEFPDNVYAEEYNRSQPSVGGIFFPGSYKEPSVQDIIQNTLEEMSNQVWKLERFFDKIELLKVRVDSLQQIKLSRYGLDDLLRLLLRFHKITQELRNRRSDREPLVIRDEYDVQYILGALLKLYFDDVRVEDYSPSNSGANSRLDFVLKEEKIIIETKMTTENLKVKILGEELLIDIGRYKAYPDCSHLVIFIYDRGDYIINKRGFIADLEKQSTIDMTISVLIVPE